MKGTDQLVAFLREVLGPYFLTQDTWQASGTWTPGLKGGGTAGTFTFSTLTGRWDRHGRMVTARCRMAVATITGTPTGQLILTGLPFVAANQNVAGDVIIGRQGAYTHTAAALTLRGRVTQNTTECAFTETFAAAIGNAPIGGVAVGTDFELTIIYEAG